MKTQEQLQLSGADSTSLLQNPLSAPGSLTTNTLTVKCSFLKMVFRHLRV